MAHFPRVIFVLWLDPYERRARLAPGLLALLPVAVALTAFGLREATIITSCLAMLSVAGGPVLVASYVRKAGLQAQERLWSEWGGSPTTLALRLREPSNNPLQQERWRSAITSVTGMHLLSAGAEQADPGAADQAIEAATAQLRRMTRGDQFGLLASENKNYGFQRNLYGLRWTGRAVAVLSCVGLAVGLWFRLRWHVAPIDIALGLIANLLLLLVWISTPSAKQVRTVGEKYADELLHAAIALEGTTAPSSNTTKK